MLDDKVDPFGDEPVGAFGVGDLVEEGPRNVAALGFFGGVLAFGAVWCYLLLRLSPVRRAYLQICLIAGLFGFRLRPHDTPIEFGGIITKVVPRLRFEVDSIVSCYVREAYGGMGTCCEGHASSWRRLRWRLPLELLKSAIRHKAQGNRQ